MSETTDKKAEGRDLREELIKRLKSEFAADLYERLQKCGQEVMLTCTNCGNQSKTEQHCMARYCPACKPIVSAERVQRWQAATSSMQWPLFMTLTIPNSEDPESLRFLKKKWSAFRRRKLIRECIVGGVASFEITNIGNGWHPHLHAICDCEWLALHVPKPRRTDSPDVKKQKFRLAKDELSSLWAAQIGNPISIVQAKRVSHEEAARYVLKYAIKSSDLLEISGEIAPMLRVLSSTRTVAGWGSLYPLPSPDDSDEPKCPCGECGALGAIMPDDVLRMIMRSR